MAGELKFLLKLLQNHWKVLFSKEDQFNLKWLHIFLLPILTYRFFLILFEANPALLRGNPVYYSILFIINFLVWILPIKKSIELLQQVKEHLYLPLRDGYIYFGSLLSIFLFPSSIFALGVLVSLFCSQSQLPSPFFNNILILILLNTSSILLIHSILSLFQKRLFRILAISLLMILPIVIGILNINKDTLLNLASNMIRYGTRYLLGLNKGFINSVPLLMIVSVSLFILSYFSFKVSLRSTWQIGKVRGSNFKIPLKIPFRYGILVKNNFIYFIRYWNIYAGLAISVYYSIFLYHSGELFNGALNLAIIVIFIFDADLVFNFFGFDTKSGIERYVLSPIRSSTILTTKNLGFGLIVFLQTLPLGLAICGLTSLLDGVLFLLKIIIIVLLYMIFGGYFSIRFPVSIVGYGAQYGQVLLHYTLAMFCSSMIMLLPDIVAETKIQSSVAYAILALTVMITYIISFRLLSKLLDKSWDTIKERLP